MNRDFLNSANFFELFSDTKEFYSGFLSGDGVKWLVPERETNVELNNNYKPSLFDILHKYFLIVNFGRNKLSPGQIVNFAFLNFLFVFRRSKLRNIFSYYKSFIDKNKSGLKEIGGIKIDYNENKLLKIILASVLISFLNNSLTNKRAFLTALDKAFYRGWFIAVNYIVCDQILDSTKFSKKEKFEFHNLTLEKLSGFDIKKSDSVFAPYINYISSILEERISTAEKEKLYSNLYLLEQAQFIDLFYRIKTNQNDYLINKLSMISLKAYFSFCAINFDSNQENNKIENRSLLWALYFQLIDDFRDLNHDKQEGLPTLFTENGNVDKSTFDPKYFLENLANFLSDKYSVKWIKQEFKQIESNRIEGKDSGLDEFKISILLNSFIFDGIIKKPPTN